MSSNGGGSASGGIGFFGLLGIVFIVLKLTGYINWSWWWVTAPLWGGFALLLLVIAVALGVAVIAAPTRSRNRF